MEFLLRLDGVKRMKRNVAGAWLVRQGGDDFGDIIDGELLENLKNRILERSPFLASLRSAINFFLILVSKARR